jgi:putative DNA primase/helicase
MTAVRESAFAAHTAGICVLPPKQDGSKAPDAESWKMYQERRPKLPELTHWYDDPRRTGVGVVTGRISGGLELLEFDDRASAWDAFSRLIEDNGLGDVWRRMTDGYLERTPSGGCHVFFHSPAPSGATKLAQRPKRPDEMRHERDRWQVLIETKGEGGYAIIAPTNGSVHPSGGRYELVSGGWASVASLTADERDAVLSVARMVDERPRPIYTPTPPGHTASDPSNRPGSDYNARTCWAELLTRYGWALDHRQGLTLYWTRPGKDQGVSATTNYRGNGLLWVFTSSTELDPDRSYDPFGFFACMEHGGDFREAARDLARQGYGCPPATADQSRLTRPIRSIPHPRGRRPVIDVSREEARHAG